MSEERRCCDNWRVNFKSFPIPGMIGDDGSWDMKHGVEVPGEPIGVVEGRTRVKVYYKIKDKK